jgi:hypothetical protein
LVPSAMAPTKPTSSSYTSQVCVFTQCNVTSSARHFFSCIDLLAVHPPSHCSFLPA